LPKNSDIKINFDSSLISIKKNNVVLWFYKDIKRTQERAKKYSYKKLIKP
jgi:hypothetical protein